MQYRKSLADKNVVLQLAIVNAVVYVFIAAFRVINGLPMSKDKYEEMLPADLQYHPQEWFSLPGSFKEFIYEPWTLLTYMFTHDRFLPLLSNMIWLFFFGTILQMLAGAKKIFPLYFYAGLAGGIAFLLFASFTGNHADLRGASPAVFGIAAAATTLSPYYKIFTAIRGGFSLWILSLIYAVLTLATVNTFPLLVAYAAAAAAGYFFIKQLQKGNDMGKWMSRLAAKINAAFSPAETQEQISRKAELKRSREEKLNRILDKINEKGIQSISREEKDFLNNQSK